MEKKEAVREWCLEKALVLYAGQGNLKPSQSKDIIETAKVFESYVTGGQDLSRRTVGSN